jgi:hypothetical protein
LFSENFVSRVVIPFWGSRINLLAIEHLRKPVIQLPETNGRGIFFDLRKPQSLVSAALLDRWGVLHFLGMDELERNGDRKQQS